MGTDDQGWRRDLLYRVLFYLIIGGFLDVLVVMSGAEMSGLRLAVPVVAAAIITYSGELVLRAFQVVSPACWLPVALVVGTAIMSCAMVPVVFLLNVPAQAAFLGLSALVLATGGLLHKRPDTSPAIPGSDVGVVFTLALLVGYFVRDAAAALPILEHNSILPLWTDYFIHGGVIATFGDPLAVGHGDIMLAGQPRMFYHYAPFMLPAALTQVTNLPGVGLASAVLLPLGLLIGVLGLYALAVELAGIGPALCAIWAVAFLPDASRYFMQNGYFGFHWLLYASPGSGYAIGIACAAYGCVIRWIRQGTTRPLALGILLAGLLMLVRAQIFVLAGPALAGTIVLTLAKPRWRAPILGLGALVIAGLSILPTVAEPGAGWFGFARPFQYLDYALSNGPQRYVDILGYLKSHAGRPVAAAAAVVMLLFASLGIFALIYPLIEWVRARAGAYRPEDYFPALLFVGFVLLMLWAPTPWTGSFDEYKHRHFVLLYAIVVLWSVSRIVQMTGLAARIARWSTGAVCSLFAVVVAATAFLYADVDPGRPSVAWGMTFYARPVEPGVPEAAEYIRSHARQGDLLALSRPMARDSLVGALIDIVSLTDVPAFVGRPTLQAKRSSDIGAVISTRTAQVAAVGESATLSEAVALLRQLNVRWYICILPDLPRWDPTGVHAAFKSGLLVVYDASL